MSLEDEQQQLDDILLEQPLAIDLIA
jgi:hypothetical protein